jgi:hypothetical protein
MMAAMPRRHLMRRANRLHPRMVPGVAGEGARNRRLNRAIAFDTSGKTPAQLHHGDGASCRCRHSRLASPPLASCCRRDPSDRFGSPDSISTLEK